jgi:hypothetical protein
VAPTLETNNSANSASKPWHVVFTMPLTASRSNGTVTTSNNFRMSSVECATMSILCCIALGAMQHECVRPAGPFISFLAVINRRTTAGQRTTASPNTSSNDGYGGGVGFPVAFQDLKPWLSNGEGGWGRFQFENALSILRGPNRVEHVMDFVIEALVQAYGASYGR